MNNTINGRTPEEIKKGLECCYGDKEKRLCDKCPNSVMVEGYSWPMCLNFDSVGEDALAYIQQLERERDAAIKDMAQTAVYLCCACKKYHHNDPGKDNHRCEMFEDSEGFERVIACDMFEWRGTQEEV